MAETGQRNLHQRLAAIQGALEGIEPTGRNQFAAKALSIGDVEGALRKLLAEHGVITRWSYRSEDGAPGLSQLEKALWQANLEVRVLNADEPADFFMDYWTDIGGNPMAATSFARKGYLKSLFHITEEGDEKGTTATTTAPRPARRSQPAPATTSPQNGVAGEIPASTVADEALKLFNAIPSGDKWMIVGRFGWSKGRNLTQWLRALSPESAVALRNALDEFLNPTPIDDPAEIPYG